MKRLLQLIALACPVFAQTGMVVDSPGVVRYVNVAPSGACSSRSDVRIIRGTGKIYTCQNGAWAEFVGTAGEQGPMGPAGTSGVNGAPGIPGYSANTLLSGGGVTWTGGLGITVASATYIIGGTEYTSPRTDITLSAAHETLDRIDAVVLTTDGTAIVVEGTAAEAPVRPDIDPDTQLELTFAKVDHGQSAPTGVASNVIYQENAGVPTEWDATVSGAGMAANSSTTPISGTYSVLATAATAGQYVLFTASTPFDLGTRNTISFDIKVTAAWASKRSLQINFASNGARVGSVIVLNNGAFGFSISSTATQKIVIPLSLFAATSTVNQLKIAVAGNQTAIGFRLDNVVLQAGIFAPIAPSGMSWKGTWNSTISYAVNEVVSYENGVWLSKVSNTNSAPTYANTNWSSLISQALRTRSFGVSFDGGGSALTADKTVYATIPYACTVQAWNIAVDAGTATVDIWRVATGTAIPTVAGVITGSGAGRPAIAANTVIHSTTLTGWSSTAIAANDILGFHLEAVATATYVNLVVECLQ